MPILTLPRADSNSVRAKAFVFEDASSRALLQRIEQVAPSDATVLVVGETGTGKELVARHVHELSRRRDRPFVAVNCGALSESLVDSELFGHERGAFTGAHQAKAGWFEAAHGGTLFLDEVGDLPLATQVKLLRVLQEGEVVRIGARQPTAVDVRLIAATNVDLAAAMIAGKFREDLYYRLNVAPLWLLPLRERQADIVALTRHFLDVYGQRLGIVEPRASEDAAELLCEHAWPGNIRELENVIHHALLICQGGEVRPEHLRLQIAPGYGRFDRGYEREDAQSKRASSPQTQRIPALEAALIELFEENPPNVFEEVERRLLRAAYRYCDRNQVHTARLLGISRNVVRARLIQYGELQGSIRPLPLSSASASPSANATRSIRHEA
jgi:sigma-54-specific transcriptional regulator